MLVSKTIFTVSALEKQAFDIRFRKHLLLLSEFGAVCLQFSKLGFQMLFLKTPETFL